MEVVLGGVSEATSVGAAVLMAEGFYGKRIATTTTTTTTTTTNATHTHKPQAEAHAVYQEAAKRQNALYEALYVTQQSMIREE
jgi:sugar (pentulose or hexulose) kinase